MRFSFVGLTASQHSRALLVELARCWPRSEAARASRRFLIIRPGGVRRQKSDRSGPDRVLPSYTHMALGLVGPDPRPTSAASTIVRERKLFGLTEYSRSGVTSHVADPTKARGLLGSLPGFS